MAALVGLAPRSTSRARCGRYGARRSSPREQSSSRSTATTTRPCAGRSPTPRRDPACRAVNDADLEGSSEVGALGDRRLLDALRRDRRTARRRRRDRRRAAADRRRRVRRRRTRAGPAGGTSPRSRSTRRARACIAASLAAGRPVTVETTGTSMAGLDAGTPSAAAWPTLADGLAGAIVVDDEEAERATRDLAAIGVEAGESGPQASRACARSWRTTRARFSASRRAGRHAERARRRDRGRDRPRALRRGHGRVGMPGPGRTWISAGSCT